VQKYAADELTKANKTLQSALIAETKEDMASLAYIGNVQVKTAINNSAAEQSRLNSIDLLAQKEQLVAASINEKKDAAQTKLQAMEGLEAEREILLAFGKIEFVSGTANLVPGASQGIDLLAVYMSKYPNKKITLSGHTDNTGSTKSNKKLSQQRADYIRDVLVSKGSTLEKYLCIITLTF
jgi:outer membrane protein OmpA-like peptidoglycan-associated protein